MIDLENTPWRFEEGTLHGEYISDLYDSEGNELAQIYDEPTAKAIAALPDTLKRLGELEEALLKIDKASEGMLLTFSEYPEQYAYQKASEIRGIIETLKTVLDE